MRLDHILMFVSDSGEEVAELEAFGLISGRRFTHVGQGTRNTCFAFENTFLELVWQYNEAEITSPAITPTKLHERCTWWQSGANPFGFSLQFDVGEAHFYPFSTWEYRPPYMPEHLPSIRMSLSTSDSEEPLVFFVPQYTPDPAHKQQTALGFKKVTGCNLWLQNDRPMSRAVDTLKEAGIVRLLPGGNHLDIEIDGAVQGKRYDCKHPNLPLSFIW